MLLKICPECSLVVEAAQMDRHKRIHSRDAYRIRPALYKSILARDYHRCTVCNTTERLEIHHKDGDFRNNDPDNLETRCITHNPRDEDARFAAAEARRTLA